MEAINNQVRGIAESSQALSSSVEESSSSILELGASGEDLNETAGTLSAKVDEVSSSIEQMVRSVSQVAETTESLTAASSETSTSMGQIHPSGMLPTLDPNAAPEPFGVRLVFEPELFSQDEGFGNRDHGDA